jgi:pyroglutamyl-peptidase
LLLTGFEPFAGQASNPSAELVRHFQARAGWTAAVLPVTFDGARAQLGKLLTRVQPRVLLMLGLARSRSVISLERVALNWVDAEIPDNDGAQPCEQPLVVGAPPALFGRIPFRQLRDQLVAAGLPAEISHSAGTYVCNALYFDALLHSQAAAAFVHVPPFERLAWGEQVRAVELLLQWAESLQTGT